MTKWYRIGTLVAALALIWIGVRMPLYVADVGLGDKIQITSVSVAICPAGAECVHFEAGRGLGGAQTAFTLFAGVLLLFLAIELIQAVREKQLDRLPRWTLVVCVLYAISFAIVWLVIDEPAGLDLQASWGFIPTILGLVPAVIAQTNLFDNFATDEELGLLPDIPQARAIHAPAVVGRTPAVVATTHVTHADFGHAGLRVRTEDGAERRIEWTGLRTIALDATTERAHLDLVTSDGEALRISRSSRVDYRFLPGGIAPTELDNLRRLEQFARERNPTAG